MYNRQKKADLGHKKGHAPRALHGAFIDRHLQTTHQGAKNTHLLNRYRNKEKRTTDIRRDKRHGHNKGQGALIHGHLKDVTVQLCYIYKENSLSSYTEHNYSYAIYTKKIL